MAKADLGVRRTCSSCNMRFYDLNRSPITCPGCGEEFNPEAVLASRKTRSGAKGGAAAQAATAEPVTDIVDENTSDLETETEADDLEADAGISFDDNSDVDDEAGGIIQDNIAPDDELLADIATEDES